MCFVNFLLGLLTLSIYRFWARTNVRKHIWSCVHINGEPLEYTGRGIELFKGALFVFVVFGLPAVLLIAGISIAYGPEHPAIGAVQTLFLFIVSLLWGAAVFRARRYQLSRTQWRGIRGWLEGSATTYSLLYFGSLLARGFRFFSLSYLLWHFGPSIKNYIEKNLTIAFLLLFTVVVGGFFVLKYLF